MDKPQEKKILGIISIIIGVAATITTIIASVKESHLVNMGELGAFGYISFIGLILGIVGLFLNFKHKKTLSIIGIILSLIGFLSSVTLYGMLDNNQNNSSSNASRTSNNTTIHNKNNIITNITNGNEIKADNLTFKITSWKIIQPGETGNLYGQKPVIAFWYDTTNNSDKEISPMNAGVMNFAAYQDNNSNQENKLQVGSLPDAQFTETQMDNIKKGGTASDAISFELDDTTTPVIFEIKNIISNKIIAKETININ